MNFFSLVHEYLLGILGVHSFNFPLREYFFVFRSPTPPFPSPIIRSFFVLFILRPIESQGGGVSDGKCGLASGS